jgi:hypothetical protein
MQWREPMSIDELERIRKRSRAGAATVTLDEIRAAGKLTEDGTQQVWQTWGFNDKRRTPWITDYEAMCWKTALHSLYKGIPLDDVTRMSQEADEGFETGRQRDFLADFHSFDPVDTQPMVETIDAEGVKAIAVQKIEQGKQDAARRKREPRKAQQETSTKAVNYAGPAYQAPDNEPPLFAEPTALTVGDYLPIIGEQAYWRILGSSGYDSEHLPYPGPAANALLRELADEAEIQRGERTA